MVLSLYITVLLIATCGLVYELIAAAMASYLLGDSVTQFSTVIGAYLFSMGVGSYLSRFVGRHLFTRFVQIEISVGLVGGASAAALFLAFAHTGTVRAVLYPVVGVIGILVGMEIPLLLRILKDRLEFRDLVAHVLAWDYLGALAASLLFPLVLVPYLGLVRASFLFGMLNVAVGFWSTSLFRDFLPKKLSLRLQCAAVMAALAAGFVFAERITGHAEGRYFGAPVLLSVNSPVQRIVITREGNDVRLYLNGHMQFASEDEYRYHEALVHPAAAARPRASRALVLGGGDGMAVRELLRYTNIASITLVDLDPEMTRLFRDHDMLAALNNGALRSPRVTVVNEDAFVWIESGRDEFDLIIVDFPDPTSYSIGKLYTTAFYRALGARLHPEGLAVIQATSPLAARKSFWCIVETLRAADLSTHPYHANVPSMGEWGYVIASRRPYEPPAEFPDGLRFIDAAAARAMFDFPRDMREVPVEPNRLDNQRLVHYYAGEWE